MSCKFHYGWFIVTVCMLLLFGTSLLTTGMSVSLSAMRSELGFTGTETSLVTTIYCAVALAATFVADHFYRRFGLRIGMAMTSMFGMTSFLIYCFAGSNIYAYYVGAMFAGLVYSWGMMLPASIIIKRWFNARRAFALSLCSAGTACATMIGSPTLQALINSFDLATSFLAEAVYMLIVTVLLFVIIRNTPSDIGIEPYGGDGHVVKTREKIQSNASIGRWIIILILMATMAGFCGNPATANIVLNFNTEGLEPMLVALGMSLYGFTLLIGKLSFGTVVDRKGARFATLTFATISMTGLSGCFLIGRFPVAWLMFMSFGILGIGYSMITLGYPNWAIDFSTSEEYPRLLKKLLIGFQLGALAGSPLPGIIADATGTYTWAYLMFGLVIAMIFVSTLTCYRHMNTQTT